MLTPSTPRPPCLAEPELGEGGPWGERATSNMNQTVTDNYLERVVDLLDPTLNRIHNLTLEEARQLVLSGQPEAVREIDGSFALLAREGKTVRMARSLDRPMRYFLAKRAEGPALIVADRIDAIYKHLKAE